MSHTHTFIHTHMSKNHWNRFFNTQIYRSIGEYGGVQHASTINSPINAPREAFGVVVAVPEMLGGWGLQPWTFECQARHGIWDPLVNPMTIELFVIRPDSSYSSFLMGESGERTLDLYGFIWIYVDLRGSPSLLNNHCKSSTKTLRKWPWGCHLVNSAGFPG